jgi:hypothetical protein
MSNLFRFQVSGFRFQVSGFRDPGFRDPGFRGQEALTPET